MQTLHLSFFSRTSRIWISLPFSRFPDNNSHQKFKCKSRSPWNTFIFYTLSRLYYLYIPANQWLSRHACGKMIKKIKSFEFVIYQIYFLISSNLYGIYNKFRVYLVSSSVSYAKYTVCIYVCFTFNSVTYIVFN